MERVLHATVRRGRPAGQPVAGRQRSCRGFTLVSVDNNTQLCPSSPSSRTSSRIPPPQTAMAEDAPKSSTAPEKPAGSPQTTPPGAQTVGNTDLKIVHTSPERPPKQKSQHADESQMSREELLEQAQKFLESAPIKNAPLKEKLEFLHTKGLTREETEALLAKLKEKENVPAAEEKGKGKEVIIDATNSI